MFPAIIQFNYQINLPEKEVALYTSQYRAAMKPDQTPESSIDLEALQLFVSDRRENLLSIQSLSELKKDTSFGIKDIKAEVTPAILKNKSSGKTNGNDFNITLTLYLQQFIVLGQFPNEDYLISTIGHLPDFIKRKPVPVKKLYNFKSLSMNTYQLIPLT